MKISMNMKRSNNVLSARKQSMLKIKFRELSGRPYLSSIEGLLLEIEALIDRNLSLIKIKYLNHFTLNI